MAPELTVEYLREDAYREWSDFVRNSPGGSAYALPDYLEALSAACGGRFRVAAIRHGDELAGGVALYERTSRFGTYVSPRLLLYYNGPVLAGYDTKYPYQETSRHLRSLTALVDFLSAAGYAAVTLKPRPPVADVRPFLQNGWSASLGYSYVVRVDDLEAIRGNMEQNLRRLVDRNLREGTVFTEDEDFDAFLSLHELTMERVGAAPYLPTSAFRAFLSRLHGAGLASLFHARLPDGRVVASQLVLLGHGVTHTVCAAADSDHMKLGASAFLRFKVFERLHHLGYLANDLTDASLNSVTRFKGQLGGALEPWTELCSPTTSRYRWGNRAASIALMSRGRLGALVRRARALGNRGQA